MTNYNGLTGVTPELVLKANSTEWHHIKEG